MGFEWINCDDPQSSIVSFIRRGSTAKNQLLFVCNFTPIDRDGFVVGVPCPGNYTEILNSDNPEFGGLGRMNDKPIKARKEKWDGRDYSIQMHLPPLSVTVFRYDYKEKRYDNTKRNFIFDDNERRNAHTFMLKLVKKK